MKYYIGEIFECEHCGKKSAWKHVITNHERACKSNPNNQHACFKFCKHLEKTTEYDEDIGAKTHFYCQKIDKNLYSYKVERRPNLYKNVIKSCDRMPLECEFYEDEQEVTEGFDFTDFFKT